MDSTDIPRYTHTNRTVTVECMECDKFQMSKSYKGVKGTPGEAEYVKNRLPESCPLCENPLERTVQTEGSVA